MWWIVAVDGAAGMNSAPRDPGEALVFGGGAVPLPARRKILVLNCLINSFDQSFEVTLKLFNDCQAACLEEFY